ncbi:unnamed protein product [Blepharisma stoltei]|uniref:Uncharacterized protein n=1 Tax=Blepharisma stoltei TaxID=1481888 RepID=A0AAU9K7S6_9CILI|nr:unnamed protein product [Blepharisma stoltei]
MLPGIKEDETSSFADFTPKLKLSLRGFESSQLKIKAKEFKARKIRVPTCLLTYRRKKQNLETEEKLREFPSINSTVKKWMERSAKLPLQNNFFLDEIAKQSRESGSRHNASSNIFMFTQPEKRPKSIAVTERAKKSKIHYQLKIFENKASIIKRVIAAL